MTGVGCLWSSGRTAQFKCERNEQTAERFSTCLHTTFKNWTRGLYTSKGSIIFLISCLSATFQIWSETSYWYLCGTRSIWSDWCYVCLYICLHVWHQEELSHGYVIYCEVFAFFILLVTLQSGIPNWNRWFFYFLAKIVANNDLGIQIN